MKTFILDIDGFITLEPNQHFLKYSESTPNYKIINKINQLYKDNTIILFTSRYEEDRSITKIWLEKYNVKYNQLMFNKPRGDYYLDDKNLSIKEFLNL